MSATAAPFGIRAVYSPTGTVRPGPVGQIASAYGTAIFQNSPIKVVATGEIEAAAAGERALGVFQGVELVDSTGQPQWRNQWVAGQALFVNSIARAYVTIDQPGLVYEVQGDAPVPLTGVGQQYNWTALAGNTITGLSSVALGVSTAGANAGLRVIGLMGYPDNDWGDLFTIVQVQFSMHQYTADIASV
jgi:hypothetical protein